MNTVLQLIITLQQELPVTISIDMTTAEEIRTATANGSNLFFTLDNALKQLS